MVHRELWLGLAVVKLKVRRFAVQHRKLVTRAPKKPQKKGWSLVVAKALVVSRNGGRTDTGQECQRTSFISGPLLHCRLDMPLLLKDLVDLKSKRCSASETLAATSADCWQSAICLCGATPTLGAQLAQPPWSSRQTLSTHPQASASRRCSHRDQADSPAFLEFSEH